MVRLVELSDSLAYAKEGGDFIPFLESFALKDTGEAGRKVKTTSFSSIPSVVALSADRLNQCLSEIFIEARMELIRQDVRRLTLESQDALKRVVDSFRKCFPGLAVQRFYVHTARFLPSVNVMNRLLQGGFRILLGAEPTEEWVKSAEGKFHLASAVFGVRTSYAISLDAGRSTKCFMSHVKL